MTETPLSIENKLSASALQLMQSHAIAPTPENYTVWYHYASNKHPALKEEIDKIIAQKMPLNLRVCDSLYHRFFVQDKKQKVIDEASATAQKMLKDVLKAVNNFSGETENYNKGLGDYVANISKDYNDVDAKDIINDLVAETLKIKQTGDQMQAKLEESKLEIDNLRKNLEQVTSEAQKDGLTSLYNRKTFELLLADQIQASQEHKTDLCLLMLDVDHFKKFNDTYGHLLGDEVLKIVSRALTDTLKGRDIVARFGGEEFIVFLPETPIEGAMRVADAVRQSIASKELKRKDTGENFGRITVSIGVSRYRHGVDDIPKLIKRADEALYESKRAGRNKVTRES